MKYQYFYQTRENENREGFIDARDRADAYTQLRKQGIRPYRVVGNDPVKWQPWAIAGGYALMTVALVLALVYAWSKGRPKTGRDSLTEQEAAEFRMKAEDAVNLAPEAFRYNVWKGVNARLEERGIEPLPKPPGLAEPIDL